MRLSTRVAVGSPPARVTFFALLGLILALAFAGAAVAAATLLASPTLPPTGPAGNGLIAFITGSDVYVVAQDGSEPRKVAADAFHTTDQPAPEWSRDGTRFAYWAQDDPSGPTHLVVVNADGSDPVVVATVPTGRVSRTQGFDWSPDGSHVTWSSCSLDDPPCEERVYVAATDGSTGDRQVAVGDSDLTAWLPRWSPDGSLIAFGGSRGEADKGAYVMSPDGSDVRKVSLVVDDSGSAFFSVSWSPDGSTLATKANEGIVTVPLADHAATDELVITDRPAVVPEWSPQGDRIAWADLESNHIMVAPAGGGDPTDLGSAAFGFVWSPDGTEIVVPSCCALDVREAATGKSLLSIPIPATIGSPYPGWQRVAP